jgi:hypothetical protein
MQLWVIGLIIVVVIAVVGFFVYKNKQTPISTSTPSDLEVAQAKLDNATTALETAKASGSPTAVTEAQQAVQSSSAEVAQAQQGLVQKATDDITLAKQKQAVADQATAEAVKAAEVASSSVAAVVKPTVKTSQIKIVPKAGMRLQIHNIKLLDFNDKEVKYTTTSSPPFNQEFKSDNVMLPGDTHQPFITSGTGSAGYLTLAIAVPTAIKSVVITNRIGCCQDDLAGAVVTVFGDNGNNYIKVLTKDQVQTLDFMSSYVMECDKTKFNNVINEWIKTKNWAFDSRAFPDFVNCPQRSYKAQGGQLLLQKDNGAFVAYPTKEAAGDAALI